MRRTCQGAGDFHIRHAQLIQTVLQEIFFGGGEIALGFCLQQAKRVDGLARPDEIDPRLPAFFVHHAHLHHGAHVKRGHEALEGDF